MSLFSPVTLSVSELNATAADLLHQQLSGIWISGEISNLTHATSGHYYFSLKDEWAQVRCVLFKFNALRLPPLNEGEHIEVCGKISLYQARGEFQITVEDVRQIGMGRLFEKYEQLKARLQAEGLFDFEHKQKLPTMPNKIGIVTSLAAAALRDVLTTLQRRAPHIPIIIYPTAVQGAGSEQQIAQAIHQANKRKEVDVLIICRGGGSLEDLWAFNEECVVRAIAACSIPTISGVGHETDITLSDFVADTRAPTPTGAAELVSPNRESLLHYLFDMCQQWQQTIKQIHHHKKQQVVLLSHQLLHLDQKIAQQQMQLKQQRQNLHTLIHQYIRQHSQNIAIQRALLVSMSPNMILQRGFAIVRDNHGDIVDKTENISYGDYLNIQLSHGELTVQVVSRNKNKPAELFD